MTPLEALIDDEADRLREETLSWLISHLDLFFDHLRKDDLEGCPVSTQILGELLNLGNVQSHVNGAVRGFFPQCGSSQSILLAVARPRVLRKAREEALAMSDSPKRKILRREKG